MSVTTTFAPSRANRIAVAFPNPEPAPVTIATFSFNCISAPLHIRAAVRAQNLSGDKPRFLRSKVSNRISDVFRLAELTHRNGFRHTLNPAFGALPQHRGIDHTWSNGVHRYTGPSQLTRHRDSQP